MFSSLTVGFIPIHSALTLVNNIHAISFCTFFHQILMLLENLTLKLITKLNEKLLVESPKVSDIILQERCHVFDFVRDPQLRVLKHDCFQVDLTVLNHFACFVVLLPVFISTIIDASILSKLFLVFGLIVVIVLGFWDWVFWLWLETFFFVFLIQGSSLVV